MENKQGRKLINEGIDIDYDNFTVAYNPSYKEHADALIEGNPTVSNAYGDGINVYSLLQKRGFASGRKSIALCLQG